MVVPPIPVIQPATPQPTQQGPRTQIIHGRFEANASVLLSHSVDLVLTSPPYAMQRGGSYDSVLEQEYPGWTSRWMAEVQRVLAPRGNVAVVIRPHVHEGRLAPYVRHTLNRLEQDGWVHCDDLIWYKPDAPPLGHCGRPRRSWELIHWFARAPQTYCNPQAAGRFSTRLGLTGAKRLEAHIHNVSEVNRHGMARASDVIVAPIRNVDRSGYNTHTAQFPPQLAEPLIRMLCPPSSLVIDPFAGSGTTVVAALSTGRSFAGFEANGGYVNVARKRLKLLREHQDDAGASLAADRHTHRDERGAARRGADENIAISRHAHDAQAP